MDYSRLPLDIRNSNIENIAVVLNTLDVVNFPYTNTLCKMDIERFKLINLIQRDFGNKVISKDDVYTFCVSFEKNI